jgi:hypothetical protein
LELVLALDELELELVELAVLLQAATASTATTPRM